MSELTTIPSRAEPRCVTRAQYSQTTGLFTIYTEVDDGGIERVLHEAHGYSGRSYGRNNPDAEAAKNIGPLPRGRYWVSLPFHHAGKGPVVFRLRHVEGVNHSRSGFLIHGDNPAGDASKGCIILTRADRDAVSRNGVRELVVTV